MSEEVVKAISRPGSRIEISWRPFLLIGALAACLFAIRLAAPPNLLDQDQERPATYVLDVTKNGHWLCQRDLFGDITSKPPLYTWLSALVTLACGRITLFSLYLPGALAALGTAWLILVFGRKYFGARAAFFAALASLLTSATLKEFGLARTDGVFAFTVTAAALLAFRAWELGKGWTWFWLLASAATLAKGPLGVALAGAGLIAAWWERKSGAALPLRGSQLPGLALFILLTSGWFLLAYWQVGQPLVAKMLGKELIGHAVAGGKHSWPGAQFYQQPLYYLGRAAPWSLLAYYGLWRIWKYPVPEAPARRFERFLFCWFLAGLLIFSLAPHQRADLLWPIMPAGALIAGRELARLTDRLREAVVDGLTAAIVLLALCGFGWYYFDLHARHPIVQQTVALKEMAQAIERQAGREFPLTHVDSPAALQVYLNTLHPLVSPPRAAELLRGPDAVFVAVRDLRQIEAARRADDPPIYMLLEQKGGGTNRTRIVSNRPVLHP